MECIFDKLKCTTPYGTAEQPADNPRKALLNSLLNSLLTRWMTHMIRPPARRPPADRPGVPGHARIRDFDG